MTPTNVNIVPAAFRPAEAGPYLGISAALVKKMIREGKLPSVKLGRARVIPRSVLDDLLANHSTACSV